MSSTVDARARPARRARPPSPSGGRRRPATAGPGPRRAGRGRISRPSAVSVTVAAQRVDLGGERGEPVGLVPADVRRPRGSATGRRPARRRAATVGVELAGVVQVDVHAGQPVGTGARSSRPARRRRCAPACASTDRIVGAGLGGARRPAAHGDLAAGDRGRGRGTPRRWRGRARPPSRATAIGPGRDPPGVRPSPSSTSTPAARSIVDGHVDVRQRRHRLAVVVHRDALVVAGAPDSSSPDTNCDDADASITTSPPGSGAGAVQRERQPRSPSMSIARRAPAARRARCPSAAPGRAGRRRSAPGRRRARPRAARTASRCRPGRSRRRPSRRRRAARRARRTRLARRRPSTGTPSARSAPTISAVSRVAGAPDTTQPAGQRGQQQRTVGHRLRPGHRDPAAHRSGRGRGGPACGNGHPPIIAHVRVVAGRGVAVRGTMDACAVATPPSRRPPTSPTSSAPSTPPTGRRARGLQRRAHQAHRHGRRAAPPARRRGHAGPGHHRAHAAAWSAGAWCRSGRRTRRPAPG